MRRPALTLVSAVVPVALLAGCGGGGSSGNARGDITVGRSGTSAPAAPVPSAAVSTGLAAPTSTTAPAGQAASGSAAPDPLGLGGLGASVSAAVGGIPTGAPGSAARSGGTGSTGSAAPGVPQPSAALPASFPASFPLPRGYRAMGASDSGTHAHVQLSVPDAGAAFSDVQQRLPGAGYTVSDVSPLAQAGGFTNGHFAFAGHGVRGRIEASGAGSTGFLTVDYDH